MLDPQGVVFAIESLILHHKTYEFAEIHADKLHSRLQDNNYDAIAVTKWLESENLIQKQYHPYQQANCYRFDVQQIKKARAALANETNTRPPIEEVQTANDTSNQFDQTKNDDGKRVKRMEEPSDDAIACYRVQIVTGMTQQTLASHMTKALKRSISQGQVSRWLKQVKEWLRAGNVLPDLPEPARRQPGAIDPAEIDMGARVDGHTQRQRHRRSEDSDD